MAAEDMLGQFLRVLGADELVVVRGADVDEGLDGTVVRREERAVRLGRGVERRVVDRVPVDLADVEIIFDFGDALGDDAVGDAPDLFGSRIVVVS